MDILIDIAAWNNTNIWQNYEAYADSPAAGIGVFVAFTDSDQIIPAPYQLGKPCSTGQRCVFALQKSTTERMGDSSGTHAMWILVQWLSCTTGNSVWGNCEETTPYSYDMCKQVTCLISANWSYVCDSVRIAI